MAAKVVAVAAIVRKVCYSIQLLNSVAVATKGQPNAATVLNLNCADRDIAHRELTTALSSSSASPARRAASPISGPARLRR
jgi:hypothetical protein